MQLGSSPGEWKWSIFSWIQVEAIHLKNPKALAVSWIDFNEELNRNSYRLQGAAQTYWGSLLGDKKALRELTSWSDVSLFYAPSTVLSMGVFLLIFTNWWLTTDRTEKDTYFLLMSEKAFLEKSRRHAHREEEAGILKLAYRWHAWLFRTTLSRQFLFNFFSKKIYRNSMLKGLQCLEKIKGLVVICLPFLLLMTPYWDRLSY